MKLSHAEDWWVSVKVFIRVDHRLTASCCVGVSERTSACASLLDHLRKNTSDAKLKDIDGNYIDVSAYNYWDEEMEPIEPQNYMAELLHEHEHDENAVAIIIMGEIGFVLPLIKSPPFPESNLRLPASTNPIFMLQKYSSPPSDENDHHLRWFRRYIGSYT